MLHAGCVLTLTLILQTTAPGRAVTNPVPAWTDDQPFTHLFQNLFDDAKHLANRDTGLIFVGGAVAAVILHPLDDNISQWALESGTPSYVKVGNVIGDGWTQFGAAVGTYVAGRVSDNAKVTHTGSDLFRAQVLSGLITQTIKITVNRERPRGGSHSFPSGHSSATFATAAVIQAHFGWKASLPLYGAAGFVAWTRVRERAHWLTDTAMGAAIGMGVGQSIGATHRRAWTVVPGVTPGGFAVTVLVRR